MAFGGVYRLKHKKPYHTICAEFNREQELTRKYGHRAETIKIPYNWYCDPTEPYEQLRVKQVKNGYRLYCIRMHRPKNIDKAVLIGTIDSEGTIEIKHPESNDAQRYLGYRLLAPRSKTFEHKRFRFNHHVHSREDAEHENDTWYKVRTDKPIYIDKDNNVFQKHKLKKRIYDKDKMKRLRDNTNAIKKHLSRLDKISNLSNRLNDALKQILETRSTHPDVAIKTINDFFAPFKLKENEDKIIPPSKLLKTKQKIDYLSALNIIYSWLINKMSGYGNYTPGYWTVADIYQKAVANPIIACTSDRQAHYYSYQPVKAFESIKQELGIVKYKEVK